MGWTRRDGEAGDVHLAWRTAEEVLRDAVLLRAARDAEGRLVGFQRGPIRDHVAAIAARLRRPGARLRDPVTVGLVAGDAWIVDGQQRLLACGQAAHGEPIPVLVVVAGSLEELRDEFVTVNDARGLPRALLAEILSGVGDLPPVLGDGTLALLMVEALNHRASSPLAGLVRRSTNPGGKVSDSALAAGLRASLRHGALADAAGAREIAMGPGLAMVEAFFHALAGVFEADWEGMTARTSRLVHGTGIQAAMHAMDAIHAATGTVDRDGFAGPLLMLRPHCRWRSGAWEFADGTRLPWDGVQNVPAHRDLLCGHLGSMLRTILAPCRMAA